MRPAIHLATAVLAFGVLATAPAVGGPGGSAPASRVGRSDCRCCPTNELTSLVMEVGDSGTAGWAGVMEGDVIVGEGEFAANVAGARL